MDKHTKVSVHFHEEERRMKVYMRENGIIISGKAWEIREYLKQQMKKYQTLKEWSQSSKYHWTAADTPKKNKGSLSIVRPIVVIGKGEQP